MTVGEAFAQAGRRARLAQALLEVVDDILSGAVASGELDDRLTKISKQFLSDVPPPITD